MRIGKIFYIFNILLVIKFLAPCSCTVNGIDTIESDDMIKAFHDMEEKIKRRRKQKLIILSSILGATTLALSIGIGFSYVNKIKNDNLKNIKLINKSTSYVKPPVSNSLFSEPYIMKPIPKQADMQPSHAAISNNLPSYPVISYDLPSYPVISYDLPSKATIFYPELSGETSFDKGLSDEIISHNGESLYASVLRTKPLNVIGSNEEATYSESSKGLLHSDSLDMEMLNTSDFHPDENSSDDAFQIDNSNYLANYILDNVVPNGDFTEEDVKLNFGLIDNE